MKRQQHLMMYSLALWNIALPLEKYTISDLLWTPFHWFVMFIPGIVGAWGLRNDSLSQNGYNYYPLNTDEADVSLNQNVEE